MDNYIQKCEFIQKCTDSGKFDEYQMIEIYCGLTTDQLKVYAHPQFKWNEMKGIRNYLNETGRTNLSEKECRFLINIGVIDTDFVW